MDALGMTHMARVPDTCWAVPPGPAERRLLDTLLGKVKDRVRGSNDPAKLGTALTYVEGFARSMPSRPLFRARTSEVGDKAAVAHNDQTFVLLREYIRARGSTRPGHVGETLSADTVSEYVGVFQAAVDADLGGRVTTGEARNVHERQKKTMRIEDGPKTVTEVARSRRLGFRGQHFKRAAASTLDRTTPRGRFRWMLSLMMYHCLMRAGEPGRGKGRKPFSPSRGVRLCDVIWWNTEVTQRTRPAVVFMLVASKPGLHGAYVRYPCEVSEKADGAADPCCLYSYFLPYWRARARAVCLRTQVCTSDTPAGFCTACSCEPLFVDEFGVVPTTSMCMEVAREMCVAIGEVAADYSGYSWRIGCATDLKEKYGDEKSGAIIKRRGRWRSCIHQVYERDDVGEQLEASEVMMEAVGRARESLLPRWNQPARQWR